MDNEKDSIYNPPDELSERAKGKEPEKEIKKYLKIFP